MKKKSLLILVIVIMTIGFASVSTMLVINGFTNISENKEDFSVIFTKAVLDGTDVYSEVIDDTKKIITFESSELKTLNQTSVLNYEVTNNSSNYDAEVSITCVPTAGATAKYTSIKNKLAGDVTIVKSKSTVDGTLTITLDKVATESVSEKYTCKLEFNATEKERTQTNSVSFEADDWSTIAANIKNNDTTNYNVGDTKSVDLGSLGVHTLRIANKSECTNGEESETACGFVVEFADIISKHVINTSSTTVGGWPASEARTYLIDTVLPTVPSELKNIMVDTKVISGHGSISDGNNFTSYDKLYLPSSEEIYADFASTSNSKYETTVGLSRQLDYYKQQGVTMDNYSGAKKQYNGVATAWWFRSVLSGGDHI